MKKKKTKEKKRKWIKFVPLVTAIIIIIWCSVTAQAWYDDSFKIRYLINPNTLDSGIIAFVNSTGEYTWAEYSTESYYDYVSYGSPDIVANETSLKKTDYDLWYDQEAIMVYHFNDQEDKMGNFEIDDVVNLQPLVQGGKIDGYAKSVGVGPSGGYDIDAGDGLPSGNNPYTIVMLVQWNGTTTGGDNTLIYGTANDYLTLGFDVKEDAGGQIRCDTYNHPMTSSTVYLTPWEWTAVFCIYDNGNWTAYAVNSTVSRIYSLVPGGTANIDYAENPYNASINMVNMRIDEFFIFNESKNISWVEDFSNLLLGDFATFGSVEPVSNITIIKPTNTTYNSTSITLEWINWTDYSEVWYNIDEAGNTSITGNTTIVDPTSGASTIYLYMLDTDGDIYGDYIDYNIYPPIANCSDAGAETVLEFYFFDEANLSHIYGNAEYTITSTETYEYSYSSSIDNVTNFTICAIVPTLTFDATITFDSVNSDQRTYYIYQGILSQSVPQNISLYLIPSSDSEKVEINVKDANDQAVENAYVNIQRYYVDENSYRTIAIGKTDSNGKFLTYIYTDTVFFKFITSIAGVVSNTVGPQVIIDTTDDPESLILYTTTTSTQYWEIRENVGANCYVNYTTNYTICTITDASGLIVSARLLVTQFDLATQPVICDTSGSGSAFTLSCFLGIDANGTYTHKLIISPDPNPSYTLITGAASFPTPSIYGDSGLFPTFLLILTIALAYAANPAIGAVLSVIGLGAAMAFEFIAIGPISIVSLMAVAMLIFVKRKSSV